MNRNFERALKVVLKHEGGYANHPSDPGGETMYGITKAVALENGYNGPMRQIPMGLVRRIYKAKYWDAAGCDKLASGVDLAVFDFAVNSGVGRARDYLRRAIGGSDAQTINRLCDARMAFLRGLKTFDTFGKGWTRRVAETRAEALAMAKAPPVKEVITTVGGGGGAAVVAKKEGLSWSEAVGIGLAVAVLVGVGWLAFKKLRK